MAAVESSSSSEEPEDTPSLSHPLLEEMKGKGLDSYSVSYHCLPGLLSRLKMVGQIIHDGSPHLVPFCETIESVFRNGLKRNAMQANNNNSSNFSFLHRA